VFETETCTETDAAGQFVLTGLPDDVDLELSIESAGFGSVLKLVHLRGAPVFLRTTRLLPVADRTTLFESIGFSYDAELGGLLAVAVTPGEGIGVVTIPEGVEITLMDSDVRPHYSRGALMPGSGLASDELDPSLQATRAGGWAIFVGVEPGDYTVRFERDGTVCSTFFPGFGFGVDDLGHVRIRVRAGFMTSSVTALCP
jgi:hypothetical protein